jgi:hypothetical protein
VSFPALFLAAQAFKVLPPLEDEEFDLSWGDLGNGLDIEWVLYRSAGAGTILGVKDVWPVIG